MTAQAGAILNSASAWDAVDWRNIERNICRLQARIVKAVQQKKWNKVRALQHLLTHSAGGKLLAVRRVTENDGRKTPRNSSWRQQSIFARLQLSRACSHSWRNRDP